MTNAPTDPNSPTSVSQRSSTPRLWTILTGVVLIPAAVAWCVVSALLADWTASLFGTHAEKYIAGGIGGALIGVFVLPVGIFLHTVFFPAHKQTEESKASQWFGQIKSKMPTWLRSAAPILRWILIPLLVIFMLPMIFSTVVASCVVSGIVGALSSYFDSIWLTARCGIILVFGAIYVMADLESPCTES